MTSGDPPTNITGDIDGPVLSGSFGGPVHIGDSSTVNTAGGDYAEGAIDKRQGTFIEHYHDAARVVI